MREGWYLMNMSEVERAVAAWRRGDRSFEVGTPLGNDEARAIKAAGNLPNADGRSLRLVIFIDEGEPLERKRLKFEPDYLERPSWRVEGSRPINVLPLRLGDEPLAGDTAWWDEPRMNELEEEWKDHGTVAGIPIPGEYRSFVFKTVVALRDAGKPVTAESIADSIERWVPAEAAAEIRTALQSKEAGRTPGL